MNYIIPLFLFILTIPQVTFPCSYQLTIQDKIIEHKNQILIGTACTGLALGAGYFVYNYYYKDQQSLNTPSPKPVENKSIPQIKDIVSLKQIQNTLPTEVQQIVLFYFLQEQGLYEKSNLGLIKITKKEKNCLSIHGSEHFSENLNDFEISEKNKHLKHFKVDCNVFTDFAQIRLGETYKEIFYSGNDYNFAIFDGINNNNYCCIAHGNDVLYYITLFSMTSAENLYNRNNSEVLNIRYPNINHAINAMGLNYFQNQVALCHTKTINQQAYISILFFKSDKFKKIIKSKLPFKGKKVSWLTDLTGIVLSKDGLLYTFALDINNNIISIYQQKIKEKNGKTVQIRKVAVDYINKHYIVFIDANNTDLFLIDLRSNQKTFIPLKNAFEDISNIKKIWINNNRIGALYKQKNTISNVEIINIDIIPTYTQISNIVADQDNKIS